IQSKDARHSTSRSIELDCGRRFLSGASLIDPLAQDRRRNVAGDMDEVLADGSAMNRKLLPRGRVDHLNVVLMRNHDDADGQAQQDLVGTLAERLAAVAASLRTDSRRSRAELRR